MKLFFLLFLFVLKTSIITGQNTWIQKADYGGCKRAFNFAFVINDKAYVGGGSAYGCGGSNHEFYEYNPVTDFWTQKTEIPLYYTCRTGFSIGQYGYVLNYDTLLRYNPVLDSWDLMSTPPFNYISECVSFVINEKAYIAFGYNNTEVWEYNPIGDSWIEMGNESPEIILKSTAIVIQNKAYIISGADSGSPQTLLNHVWEYNPTTDIWIQKMDFPGNARQSAIGFSTNNKGYFGTGYDDTHQYTNDFWEYDSMTDTWISIGNSLAPIRQAAVSFSINDKGYLTNGYVSVWSVEGYEDLWEFSTATSISETKVEALNIFPNPTTGKVSIQIEGLEKVEIYNVAGRLIKTSNRSEFDLSQETKGVYFVKVITSQGAQTEKLVLE